MSAEIVRLADRGRPFRPHPVNPFRDAIEAAASLNQALYGVAVRHWADVALLWSGQRNDDKEPA